MQPTLYSPMRPAGLANALGDGHYRLRKVKIVEHCRVRAPALNSTCFCLHFERDDSSLANIFVNYIFKDAFSFTSRVIWLYTYIMFSGGTVRLVRLYR
jgi:hypothetical protein